MRERRSRITQALHPGYGHQYRNLVTDPRWGPLKGAVEYFQRDAITSLHPGATTDIQRVIMARRIGIGGREREKTGNLR